MCRVQMRGIKFWLKIGQGLFKGIARGRLPPIPSCGFQHSFVQIDRIERLSVVVADGPCINPRTIQRLSDHSRTAAVHA